MDLVVRGQEKLGGRGLDAVDGGNLVAGGLVHVEVGGFGTHQERLRVKVVSVRGRHHDVRAEARLDGVQAPVDTRHQHGPAEHRHRHEH